MRRSQTLLLALALGATSLVPASAALGQRAQTRTPYDAAIDHLNDYLSVYHFMVIQLKITPINLDRMAADQRQPIEVRLARALVNIYDRTSVDSMVNIVRANHSFDAVMANSYIKDPAFLEKMLSYPLEGYGQYRIAGDKEEIQLNARINGPLAQRIVQLAQLIKTEMADSVVSQRARRRAAIAALVEAKPDLFRDMMMYQAPPAVEASRERLNALINNAKY